MSRIQIHRKERRLVYFPKGYLIEINFCLHDSNSLVSTFLSSTAVQHERGPRKPKLHLLNSSSGNHHHHHHPNSTHNGQNHTNLLTLHSHHHGPFTDSNHNLHFHPPHLHHHHPYHTAHQTQLTNGANSNNSPSSNASNLITNVSASFNYTAHLTNHHHHHPSNPQQPFTGATFPHPTNNNNNSIPIHHPQPLPFNTPLNGTTSLLGPQKLESNQSSAFEVPQLTIKNSASDQESHYTRKSDEDSAISPSHTIKSSSSPSLSSPDHVILVDRPCTGMRSLKESQGNSEDAASPRSPSLANMGTTTAGGQRQSEVLEMLMRSDKCQEFIQYQMQNSLFFPQSTFWPPPPPLLPLPPTTPTNNNINNSTVPSPANLPSWEVLQETTARLLFMAVRWVRCLVPFQTLSKADQHLLLQVG